MMKLNNESENVSRQMKIQLYKIYALQQSSSKTGVHNDGYSSRNKKNLKQPNLPLERIRKKNNQSQS